MEKYMKNTDRLHKAKTLLTQALKECPNSNKMSETRHHIRQAITGLEKQAKSEGKKADITSQHENWWGNVEAGMSSVAASPMSLQAQVRALDAINKMIEEAQTELDLIENGKSNKQPKTDLVLND